MSAEQARGSTSWTLRLFAWLDLVGGIAVGVWVLFRFGSGSRISLLGTSRSEPNLAAIGLGLAAIAQGILVPVAFFALARIRDDVAALRAGTAGSRPAPLPETENGRVCDHCGRINDDVVTRCQTCGADLRGIDAARLSELAQGAVRQC